MMSFNDELPDMIEVNKISEFKLMINEIKNNVLSGNLIQYDNNDEFSNYIDISEIDVEGPWPDFFILYFWDSSRERRYRFSCEMYHGAGGKWERI